MAEVRLLGPTEVRTLAESLDVTPTKRLGQNFVHDANTVRRIVRIAGLRAGETVAEVGPGLGSLTLGLLETGASVVAVEIDGRLADRLLETVAEFAPEATGRLTVIHEDALRVTELPGDPARLVANLPYNVSVSVLLHLLEHVPSLRSGVVMVQAEVGQRLAAGPGGKAYGAPSVKAAWYGEWATAGSVSRQVFWPVPNVDSILVSFERHTSEPGDEALRRATFQVVDAAFRQRRKMLRQALAPVFGDAGRATVALEESGIDPTLRGEQLLLAQFVELGRRLQADRL